MDEFLFYILSILLFSFGLGIANLIYGLISFLVLRKKLSNMLLAIYPIIITIINIGFNLYWSTLDLESYFYINLDSLLLCFGTLVSWIIYAFLIKANKNKILFSILTIIIGIFVSYLPMIPCIYNSNFLGLYDGINASNAIVTEYDELENLSEDRNYKNVFYDIYPDELVKGDQIYLEGSFSTEVTYKFGKKVYKISQSSINSGDNDYDNNIFYIKYSYNNALHNCINNKCYGKIYGSFLRKRVISSISTTDYLIQMNVNKIDFIEYESSITKVDNDILDMYVDKSQNIYYIYDELKTYSSKLNYIEKKGLIGNKNNISYNSNYFITSTETIVNDYNDDGKLKTENILKFSDNLLEIREIRNYESDSLNTSYLYKVNINKNLYFNASTILLGYIENKIIISYVIKNLNGTYKIISYNLEFDNTNEVWNLKLVDTKDNLTKENLASIICEYIIYYDFDTTNFLHVYDENNYENIID